MAMTARTMMLRRVLGTAGTVGISSSSNSGSSIGTMSPVPMPSLNPSYSPLSDSAGIITTSVTVQVTIGQVHKHLMSYLLLWVFFLLAALLCCYQVLLDHKRTKSTSGISSGSSVGGGAIAGGGGANGGVAGGGGDVLESGANSSSTGDKTRRLFYRLLLFALLSRVLLMPIAVYSGSAWLQFTATTFPMMAFASAWALLVSFFVQLVAAATGHPGDYSNSIVVMQAIAYTLYGILDATYIVNRNASVLVFALICCIYAGLSGTLVYAGPQLVVRLKVRLSTRPSLATRLVVCCTICTLAFLARTIALAVMVVAPPKILRWWWSYGTLELLPSVVLLLLMQPLPWKRHTGNAGTNNNNNNNSKTDSPNAMVNKGMTVASAPYSSRRGSNQSDGNNPYKTNISSSKEQTPLLKPAPVYGTTTNTGSNSSSMKNTGVGTAASIDGSAMAPSGNQ